jgi:hypothetical protein
MRAGGGVVASAGAAPADVVLEFDGRFADVVQETGNPRHLLYAESNAKLRG